MDKMTKGDKNRAKRLAVFLLGWTKTEFPAPGFQFFNSRSQVDLNKNLGYKYGR